MLLMALTLWFAGSCYSEGLNSKGCVYRFLGYSDLAGHSDPVVGHGKREPGSPSLGLGLGGKSGPEGFALSAFLQKRCAHETLEGLEVLSENPLQPGMRE